MKLTWNLTEDILRQLPKGAGQLSFHYTRPAITATEHGHTLMVLDPDMLTLHMPEKVQIPLEGLRTVTADKTGLVLTYEDDTVIRAHASQYASQIARLLSGMLQQKRPVHIPAGNEKEELEAARRYQKGEAALKVDSISGQELYEEAVAYAQVNDRTREWKALKRAAELSHPDAHYQMAVYLAAGMYGQAADPVSAYHHMEQAAHLGNKSAPYYLANWYRTGFGTEKDLEKAVLWYQQDDSVKSLVQLAMLYGDELHDRKKAVETAGEALAKTQVAKTREILQKKLEAWSQLENEEEKEGLQAWTNYHSHIQASPQLKVTAADLMEQAKEYAQVEDREAEWNCLVRAAHLNHPQAHYQLGTYLATGMYSHPTDPQGAFVHMRNAADLGNPDAAYYLGSWSRTGFGTEKDLKQAEFWLKKDDTLKGKIQLALLYGDDLEDYGKAISLADEILAASQVVHTKKVMGKKKAGWQKRQDALRLEAGKDLRIAHVLNDAKEYDLAAEFLEKAAPYSVEARYLLGLLYLKGQGVPADKNKAREYLSTATDLQPESLYYLTYLEEDKDKAREYGEAYLKKGTNLAHKGQVQQYLHPDSPASLRRKGVELLENGDMSGVKVLKQAADGGDAQARLLWAQAMLEKDPGQAVSVLKEEADKGVADAMALLAYCYANGLGVVRDGWRAQWLLQRAAANGSRIAREWITE